MQKQTNLKKISISSKDFNLEKNYISSKDFKIKKKKGVNEAKAMKLPSILGYDIDYKGFFGTINLAMNLQKESTKLFLQLCKENINLNKKHYVNYFLKHKFKYLKFNLKIKNKPTYKKRKNKHTVKILLFFCLFTIFIRETNKTYIFKRRNLQFNFIQKRYMLTKLGKLIMEGKPFNSPGITSTLSTTAPHDVMSRNFATWQNGKRNVGIPPKPAPVFDPNSGLEIIPRLDYSGHAHFLLMDFDFVDTVFYKVYGTWTTSNHPFQGIWPLKVSLFNLLNKKKTQYIHLYEKPKLIEKEFVTLSPETTLMLNNSVYKEFLAKIKTND